MKRGCPIVRFHDTSGATNFIFFASDFESQWDLYLHCFTLSACIPGFLSNSIFDMSRFMHSPEWLSSHIRSVFSAEWLCFPCWKAITCVSSKSISPKRTQMLSTSNLEHVKPTSTLNCWIIYNSHMSHKKTYPIQPHHVEWLIPSYNSTNPIPPKKIKN